MLKKFTLLSLFSLFGIGLAIAQNINHYQITASGYSGTMTNMANPVTQLIGGNQTEGASAVTSIGFDFVFMGKIYNSFSVNTNGVLRLGDEAILPEANTYGIPGNDRIVAFAGVSTVNNNQFLGTSATGRVRSKVTGNAPNRVLTVEWLNVYTPGYGGYISDFSFQLRLYESALASANNGRIEFIYAPITFRKVTWVNEYQHFRTGFGIGPEQGNFVAVDLSSSSIANELDFLSEVTANNNYFTSTQANRRLFYQFQAAKVPTGSFKNFSLTCPSPNSVTVKFEEDGADEAGIAVYRKLVNQPDQQFQLVKSLAPDARYFSDGNIVMGLNYVYRFYLLGEGKYASAYTDFTTGAVQNGRAYQAVSSGKWTNKGVWGGKAPGAADHVEIGCGGSVFVSADGDVQVVDLTIHQGSFLTIEDGKTLSVSGNFINNGVFNPVGSGRIIFNGSEQQEITNNGRGLSNDATFASATNWVSWAANASGVVAQKSITLTDPNFVVLKSVKVNLEYDYLRDITLLLEAPNGTRYLLSKSRGQQGRDYSDVVFVDTGVPLPPTIQNVNLTGEYQPEERFSAYSGPMNGTWKLLVKDDFTGAGGRINRFELVFSKGGSNDLVMRNITVNNTSAEGLILRSGIVIQRNLDLQQGVVHTTDAAPVILESGAGSNAGNALSFINGPVLKKGNTPFVFPLGDGGKWAPLAIENLKGANAATTFKARYYKQKAIYYNQVDASLHHVSALEYWDLSPVAGAPTVDLVLHWKDAQQSDITDLVSRDLVVAHFTSNVWKSEGGELLPGSQIGAEKSGAVKTRNISTFSPFTFGSVEDVNQLPVQMTAFDGVLNPQGVLLSWSTASELNNSHFEVQKSYDARTWYTLASIPGNGTTHIPRQYAYTDTGAGEGLQYYRLKQVDFDGVHEYSEFVAISKATERSTLSLYPNPATTTLVLQSSRYPAEVVLWSTSGVAVMRKRIGESSTTLELPPLPAGVYVLQVIHSQGNLQERLVIQ